MLSSRNLLMLTALGAMLATAVLFVGVATRSGSDRALPVAEAQPILPLAPTTTASAAPTTSAPPKKTTVPGTDEQGFVGSEARCGDGQSAVAFGRTQRSLVAICAENSGGYEYRGVRISDGATLTATAEATGDGTFVARNDGAVYTVSPANLVVTAGGRVIYSDTWIGYEAPSFAAEGGATTSAAPTTSPTTTAKPR